MEVTSTRIRVINGSKFIAIASITLDNQLIINDIKVEKKDEYTYNLIFPRSMYATQNNQSNIVATRELQRKIYHSVIHQLHNQVDNLST